MEDREKAAETDTEMVVFIQWAQAHRHTAGGQINARSPEIKLVLPCWGTQEMESRSARPRVCIISKLGSETGIRFETINSKVEHVPPLWHLRQQAQVHPTFIISLFKKVN